MAASCALSTFLVLVVISYASAGIFMDSVPDPTFFVDLTQQSSVRDQWVGGSTLYGYFDFSGSYNAIHGYGPTAKGNCVQLTFNMSNPASYANMNNMYLTPNNYPSSYLPGLPYSGQSRSICVWGKSNIPWNYAANPAGNWQSFFSQGRNSPNWNTLNIGVNPQGRAWAGGYLDQVGMQGLPVGNNWNHLCFTYNSTHGSLYQNGSLVNTQAFTLNSYTDYVHIGYAYGQSAPYLYGSVTEIVAWNTVLTPKQIFDVYSYNATSCSPFYRTSTPQMRVDMTTNNVVEIVSNTSFTRAASISCGINDTPIGKCGVCNFTGAAQMPLSIAQPPNMTSPTGSPKSICAWVRRDTTVTARQMAFTIGGSSSYQNMYIGATGSNVLTGSTSLNDQTVAWQSNYWTHVCHTYDGFRAAHIYINGTWNQATTQYSGYWPSYFVFQNTIIGGLPGNTAQNWVGSVANVVGYNTALSQQQVTSLYQASGCNSYYVECKNYGTNFVWVGDKCGCLAITPSSYTSTLYPSVVSRSFTNNTLNVVLQGPFVNSRVFTSVTTEGASSSSCSLGGENSYWVKEFTTCNDTLTFKLPWINHANCGFDYYSEDSQYFIHKGKILVTYEETLGNLSISNTTFTRVSYQTYEVYINFAKSIRVKSYNFTVWSVAVIDFVYSGEFYDANTKVLTLQVDSILPWSSMIDAAITPTLPSGVLLNSAASVSNANCPTTANTQCTQRITFKVALADVNGCFFSGRYKLNGTIWSCRNGTTTATAGCIPTRFAVYFDVASGSICTKVTMNPEITGFLTAYPNVLFDNAVVTYSLTEPVYFKVTTLAGDGNIVYITFLDINAVDTRDGSTKSLLASTVVTNDGKLAMLDMKADQKYFSLYLSRSVFSIAYNKPAIFTFNAKMEVQYQGNKKRYIEASWEMGETTEKSVSTQIRVSENKKAALPVQDDDYAEEQDIDVATVAVIAAAAGLVALVIGIAGAAYYFKGRFAKRYSELPQHSRRT